METKTDAKTTTKPKIKSAKEVPAGDAFYKDLGEEAVKVLQLKADKETGLVATTWGTKSAIGLGKALERLYKCAKKGEKYNPEND